MANRPKHKTVSNNGVSATRVSNNSVPSNNTLTRSMKGQHCLQGQRLIFCPARKTMILLETIVKFLRRSGSGRSWCLCVAQTTPQAQ